MPNPILHYLAPAPADPTEAGVERARAEQMRRGLRVYAVVTGVIAAIRLVSAIGGWDGPGRLAASAVEVTWMALLFAYAGKRRQLEARRWAWTSAGSVGGVALAWWVGLRVDGLDGFGLDGVFWDHMLASLLLPWTWREGLAIGAALVAGNLVFTIFDAALTPATLWRPLMALVFSPAAIGPGVAISWYRHSKFRRRHVMTAESRLYRGLAREMEGARRIHEASLPREYACGDVRVHYDYQPHRQLGGDLLFVYPRTPADNGAFTVIVLDVAGHGIAAALTVNRVVGEIERLVAERERAGEEQLRPAELARGLNRYVRLTLASHGLFATAFIARVESADDRLTWVNCGHPTAFLRDGSGAIVRLESDAMMLGVADEEEMGAAEKTDAFSPGAVLLACTDGATEARPEGSRSLLTEGFGKIVEQVVGTVAESARWPGEIARRVALHRGGPADDDTLLVAVAREGRQAILSEMAVAEVRA